MLARGRKTAPEESSYEELSVWERAADRLEVTNRETEPIVYVYVSWVICCI